jgi:hypothetical protein
MIPIGTDIKHAKNVTRNEPMIKGKIPNEAGSEFGYQYFPKINLMILKFLKNAEPSINKNIKIKITKIIDNIPHKKITFSITISILFFIFIINITLKNKNIIIYVKKYHFTFILY